MWGQPSRRWPKWRDLLIINGEVVLEKAAHLVNHQWRRPFVASHFPHPHPRREIPGQIRRRKAWLNILWRRRVHIENWGQDLGRDGAGRSLSWKTNQTKAIKNIFWARLWEDWTGQEIGNLSWKQRCFKNLLPCNNFFGLTKGERQQCKQRGRALHSFFSPKRPSLNSLITLLKRFAEWPCGETTPGSSETARDRCCQGSLYPRLIIYNAPSSSLVPHSPCLCPTPVLTCG